MFNVKRIAVNLNIEYLGARIWRTASTQLRALNANKLGGVSRWNKQQPPLDYVYHSLCPTQHLPRPLTVVFYTISFAFVLCYVFSLGLIGPIYILYFYDDETN